MCPDISTTSQPLTNAFLHTTEHATNDHFFYHICFLFTQQSTSENTRTDVRYNTWKEGLFMVMLNLQEKQKKKQDKHEG